MTNYSINNEALRHWTNNSKYTSVSRKLNGIYVTSADLIFDYHNSLNISAWTQFILFTLLFRRQRAISFAARNLGVKKVAGYLLWLVSGGQNYFSLIK